MRLNIVTSILVLLLATASIGGATMAWFIGDAHSGTANFTAGTVTISDPAVEGGENWQPGECEIVKWNITNNGSKKAYLRVKPDIDVETFTLIYIASHVGIRVPGSRDDTAWVGEPDGPTIPSGPNWNRYFEYVLGLYNTENRYIQKIMAGSNHIEIGYAEVWDDGEKLYISYHLSSGTTDAINIYAGLSIPTRHNPGGLGFSYYFSPRVAAFDFETEYIFFEQGGEPVVSIYELANPEVSGLQWDLAESSQGQWVEGDDGWWYYGTAAGLTEVASGETVTISFLFCLDENFDGTATLALLAEAVQSSHNAVDHIWPDRP